MKTKLKRCSVCGKDTVLWKSSPPTCKDCVGRQKAKEEANMRYKPSVLPVFKRSVKKVSDKQQKINAAYVVLKRQFIKDHPRCQANINSDCYIFSNDIHHIQGRGKYMLDTTTWVAVCRSCHDYLHAHDSEARELGLLKSRIA